MTPLYLEQTCHLSVEAKIICTNQNEWCRIKRSLHLFAIVLPPSGFAKYKRQLAAQLRKVCTKKSLSGASHAKHIPKEYRFLFCSDPYVHLLHPLQYEITSE